MFLPNIIIIIIIYLNRFTVEKVITKIKKVNLLLRHSVYYKVWLMAINYNCDSIKLLKS